MFLGIDLHKRAAQVAVRNDDGALIEETRVKNGDLEAIAERYAGALALLASFVVTPLLALAGSVLVGVVLLGALGSHVKAGDEPGEMVPAAVLLVLAVAVSLNHAGVVLRIGSMTR